MDLRLNYCINFLHMILYFLIFTYNFLILHSNFIYKFQIRI